MYDTFLQQSYAFMLEWVFGTGEEGGQPLPPFKDFVTVNPATSACKASHKLRALACVFRSVGHAAILCPFCTSLVPQNTTIGKMQGALHARIRGPSLLFYLPSDNCRYTQLSFLPNKLKMLFLHARTHCVVCTNRQQYRTNFHGYLICCMLQYTPQYPMCNPKPALELKLKSQVLRCRCSRRPVGQKAAFHRSR